MQSVLHALPAVIAIPWSLSVPVTVIVAMITFRKPIGDLIGRSHEFKAGRLFSLKAKPGIDTRKMEAILREIQESAPAAVGQTDVDRLIVRDSNGKVRVLISITPAGEPFLAIIDDDGEIRASLTGSSAADPERLTMLMLRGKGKAPDDMACLIGAERDGSGTIGVRDRSGEWKEIS